MCKLLQQHAMSRGVVCDQKVCKRASHILKQHVMSHRVVCDPAVWIACTKTAACVGTGGGGKEAG